MFFITKYSVLRVSCMFFISILFSLLQTRSIVLKARVCVGWGQTSKHKDKKTLVRQSCRVLVNFQVVAQNREPTNFYYTVHLHSIYLLLPEKWNIRWRDSFKLHFSIWNIRKMFAAINSGKLGYGKCFPPSVSPDTMCL